MTNQVPDELLELANVERDVDFAATLFTRADKDIRRALNYEMISQPQGGALSIDSFLASVRLDVASNDRLAKAVRAAPGSFLKSIMLAAQCKLLVGNHYGLFYLIPRWNKKLRCEEVTPMIGYNGMCEMAQRHPRVHKVEAFLIYEGEAFSFNPGVGKLVHEYNLDVDRSDDTAVQAGCDVPLHDLVTRDAGWHLGFANWI